MDALRAGDDLGEDEEKYNGDKAAYGNEGDDVQNIFDILYQTLNPKYEIRNKFE